MAKITALPLASPLDGSETLPIVQGGATWRTSMTALRAFIIPYLQQWYKGDKGDPGGAVDIGLLSDAAGLRVPAGTNAVIVSGARAVGDAFAGMRLVADPAVDAAYVAANPTTAFRDAGGRGFRRAVDLDGYLAPVAAGRNVPGSYALPADFNDQLGGTRIICDGNEWRFERSRFDLLDFTRWASTNVTTFHVDWSKSDANDGLTPATAFRTFDKMATAVAALPAGSYVDLVLMNATVGYLSAFEMIQPRLSGRNVRIRSGHASGRTRFLAMREDRDMASFAWVQHGTAGAWKSNSIAAGPWVAQFFTGDLDADGIPRPIVSTGQTPASVMTDEYTSHWDGTWLYVHLPNGVKPNPAIADAPGGNWLYCNNTGHREFGMDSGILLLDGIDVFSGAAGVAANCLRFRSASAPMILSAARVALRACHLYGASGNGMGTFDIPVVVTERCVAAWCGEDLFNIHSFNSTAARGAAITYYEDRARGHHAGYRGFAWGLPASASANGSTVHDGASVARAGSVFRDIADCCFADVNGVDSINFGIRAPINLGGAASYYAAAICYEAKAGEGTRRRCVLVGAAADYGPGTAAIQLSGDAPDAVILVDRWQGDATAPIRSWHPEAGRAAAGTFRRYADNGLLFPLAA
ncbi:hypothetical protein [uncultured Sphingomonas sp.]|uniref:hypothetical protein n=1 Tax=uncultured Sphingomonas sp. TaxID=158754 RepID=UPI00258F0260|nr:hypothetical protein [uncultured Sphingomonas sp.]